MQSARDAKGWMALCGLAMALGWGLRGFIGGGPLGAMIPGAMIGLLAARLLHQEGQAPWLAACGAIGFGLGGQITYGQTVGLSLKPESFWWAMLGFAVKGGVWGLAAGAVLGAGLLRVSSGWNPRRFLWGWAAMLVATWAGWRLVNAPKVIYFSAPWNKPREEVWAGLLAGSFAFLLVAARGAAWRAWRLALWTCASGALGFPLGAALQVWGRGVESLHWLDWWKGMEFTFGACLGAGCGFALWRSRRDFAPGPVARQERTGLVESLTLAAAAAVVCIGIEYCVPLRFNYSLAGAALLAAALRRPLVARHAAISVTVTAFVMDLVENTPWLSGAPGCGVVAAAAVLAAAWVSKEHDARTLFLGLTWSAVAVSLVKTFSRPSTASPGHLLTEALFAGMALLCTLWLRESCNEAAGGAVVAS